MELKTEVGGKTKHMVPCSKEQIKPWIHLTYQKFPKYIYTDQENWRFLILQLNDTNKLKIIKVNNKSCSSKGGDEDLYDQIWKREKVKWRDKSETNQSKNISYGYKKCRQIDPRVSLLQTFSETGSVLKVITKGICFQSFPPLL